MCRALTYLFTLLILLGTNVAQATQNIWQDVTVEQKQFAITETRNRYFDVDNQALKRILERSPAEYTVDKSNIIQMPMPDGSLARFAVVESPIMEPDLASKYPQIKNYKVYGIDDPQASGRLSFNPKGLDGMLHTSQGRVFIDQYGSGDQINRYVLRNQPDTMNENPVSVRCLPPRRQQSRAPEFCGSIRQSCSGKFPDLPACSRGDARVFHICRRY